VQTKGVEMNYQPWQELTPPEFAALTALQNAHWAIYPKSANPFGNSGAKYDGIKYKVHAYSWTDEEQEYNFAWRDIRISWYKYLGRGTTINREMKSSEILEMLRECMAETLQLHNSLETDKQV
jgi:hypothetical protein